MSGQEVSLYFSSEVNQRQNYLDSFGEEGEGEVRSHDTGLPES